MLFYPQLSSGAVSQFPVTRRNSRRTLVNEMSDGTTIRVADDGAATVAWELGYSHLTGGECSSLQAFFGQTYGQWQSFTFLDPVDNLLNWTEDLTQPIWEADPLISLAGSAADPLRGTGALVVTNGAQAPQQIAQTQQAPSNFQYCFSLYLRSEQPSGLVIFASDGSVESDLQVTTTSAWTRVSKSFRMSSQATGITVGIRLAAGSTVSVFGPQLEAQVGAGGYKKTRDRAGVYPNTRFDQDTLQPAATGVNQYSCSVKLISNVAG